MNLKSIFKGVTSTLIAGAIVGTCTIPAFAESTTSGSSKNYAVTSGVFKALDREVSEDSVDQSSWSREFELDENDGAQVNFWISNNGSNDIKISIDGKVSRTIAPGKQGSISAEVKNGWFGWTYNYTFTASPTAQGGSVKMKYKIAQRNN
ncbi:MULTISPECIES: hypothetical protein [Bacillus amyloliquefaciens group]|uniref:hypothetical protein n=1 Tax=Bacillus amyloliquefaciens group TaxID=1938374 RepID=UPI000B8BE60B|nr:MULTISPECIES: hypothetical protein [Bacillus amyloliquefaciens group]ASP25158.1 hypothetical protein CG798_08150 [Bacillus velezensis]ATO09912.1 hypothetical protein CRH11_07880 [Bacillus velezensis]AZI45827.1 hypothetical protein BVMH_02580 [Bacillus velezensis]MBE7958544.1 hypothetical protein [Bacillus amyloliquefaciens]MBG9462498.1 hypothetical protein [Bacillus amyloliquefaciens]